MAERPEDRDGPAPTLDGHGVDGCASHGAAPAGDAEQGLPDPDALAPEAEPPQGEPSPDEPEPETGRRAARGGAEAEPPTTAFRQHRSAQTRRVGSADEPAPSTMRAAGVTAAVSVLGRGASLPEPAVNTVRSAGAPQAFDVELGPATAQPSVTRGSRPLDDDLLDELAAQIPTLPEPLAAIATGVEVARAEGDATGVRKRLFELGVAVVRYALSVALALLHQRLDGRGAPRPIAEALGRAARLSDGAWCGLGRTVASGLEALGEGKLPAMAFLSRKALAELVSARNRFTHGGGSGDRALELTLAVLREAEVLLGWQLRVVAATEPAGYEPRVGVPLRPGVWRKQRQPLPAGLEPGRAYLVHDAGGEPRWLPLTPWLPEVGRRLLLLDSPHAAGSPWRSLDSETGEHRECPELDRAIRALAGEDPAAPVAACERPSLVGRQSVIGVLRRSAELSRAGAVTVVVLTGPQGIGRGRMLETMRETAAAYGFGTVLDAGCLEQRRGVLRPLRRAVADVAALGIVGEALGRAAAGDAVGGAEGLAAAIEAVEEALIESSLGEPILLLLDDAQWADESTLTLLSLLTERATRKAQGRMLVVVAARDEPHPPAALTRFIGQVERDVGAGATRLALGPLDVDESRQLVRSVAPLAPALEQILVEGAAGVPFLLVQAVLGWSETGALAWRESAWHPSSEAVLRAPVPGVADLVRARLVSTFDPGSEAERSAQQVLAVIGFAGGPLPLQQLEQVLAALGAGAADVERALEALCEAGLLVSSRERHEVGYAQPMVRHAVLEGLRQRPWAPRLRRALLAVMAGAPGAAEDAAFLAHAYHELGDVEAGGRWLRVAVEHALTMGLFREAVEHADRLAALARDHGERVEAELLAAEALLRMGEPAAARERHTRAAAGSDQEARLDVRARILGVGIAFALGQSAEHSDPELIAAADALGDARLGIEARRAVAAARRGALGLELSEQALAMLPAEEHGDLRYRVLVLRCELLEEIRSLEAPECVAALEQARDAARVLRSRWALLDADNDLAIHHSTLGNHELATATMMRVAEQARAAHFGSMHRGALVNIAAFHLRAARLRDAADAATRAADVAREAGDWRSLGMAQSICADALRQLEELPAARAAIDEAIEVRQRAGDANLAIALFRRAEIHLASGGAREALADSERALGQAQAAGNQDQALRARLWIAVSRFALREPGAQERLALVVAEAAANPESLRPPTRQLLEVAQAQLRAAGTC